MTDIKPAQIKKQKNLALLWGVTFLLTFPILIAVGYLMRTSQGELYELNPDTFYAFMTFHGLGMVGLMYSVSFAGLWYLISTRYVSLNVKIGNFVYWILLLSILSIAYATLLQKFGAGWYLLYPLPFVGANWSVNSTAIASIGLIVAGLTWLLGILHVLFALARHYGGFTNLLGWQYLRKKTDAFKPIPTVIMITTIALIPAILGILAAAVLLILFVLQVFEPSLSFDPLMMKNLVMFFGHIIANVTMYCTVGWVYALLPEFTGRAWKMDKVLVYSWNATFFFIVFAFFHHMYMDFVQPSSMQYIGQIISYCSAIPATAVTMFGVIKQLYRCKIKWGIIPMMFLLGMTGWAIGGFAAVVDSTIAANTVLHNTLWVPAHFHTYLLMGVVPFILGFLFYLFSSRENRGGNRWTKSGFWIYVIGGYGFLLMFYLGGINSVPRRFSSYSGIQIDSVKTVGIKLAHNASLFIILLSLGLLIMYFTLFGQFFKGLKAKPQPEIGS